MRRKTWRSVVVGGVGVLAAVAEAGVIEQTGAVSLWGRSSPYTSWNVFADPVDAGSAGGVSGTPRGMDFHNGRLYVAHGGDLIGNALWFYEPGATGNLTVSNSRRPNFGPGDSRRFHSVLGVAINTSGAGYGGFAPGAEPLIVTQTRDQAGGAPTTVTVADTASPVPVSALAGLPGAAFPPASIEYSRALDRFLSVESSINPTVAVVHVRPHTSAGLGAPTSSFTLAIDGVTGVDVISGSFAGALLGQNVPHAEVLLALSQDVLGQGFHPRLSVWTYAGVQLGQTQQVPIPTSFERLSVKALAVDEANGLIFVGDSELGRITTLTVPGPGAGACVLGMLMCGVRRRR
ncbi:MAG: hypothetical protein SFY69_12870 [Planctomycetota bacterium]|nr:hypothetical protein [Planctomycetota bacterium]